MTLEMLKKMDELHGQGKTRDDIAEELDITRIQAARYLNALVTAKTKGLDKVDGHVVKLDLFRQYLGEKKPETMQVPAGKYQNQLSSVKATAIMEAFDERTSDSVIVNLMGIEYGTVQKLRAYVTLIKNKESEKALAYRRSGVFREDVFDQVERRYKFSPKEADPDGDKCAQMNVITKNVLKLVSLEQKLFAVQGKVEAMEENQRELIRAVEVLVKAVLQHDKDVESIGEYFKMLGRKIDDSNQKLLNLDQTLRFLGSNVLNRANPNGPRH